MSYCRWSSDGFKCDVYCYAHVDGVWVTHVAGRKKVGLDTLPPDGLSPPFDWNAKMAFDKAYEALSEWRDITLPHANETFRDASPGECADRLEHLRSLGYHIPQYAIDELREEEREEKNNE